MSDETERHRCGSCTKFRTPKCLWQYGRVPAGEPKIVHGMKEFLEAFYKVEAKPVPMKLTYYPIEPLDQACSDWEER